MTSLATAHDTVLVLNSGSSSVKYQLVDPIDGTPLASGLVERIGEDTGVVTHKHDGTVTKREQPIKNHTEALEVVLALFDEVGPNLAEAHIVAVGHRVVQGADVFAGPTLIDDQVQQDIAALSPLAPLHNPPHVEGIAVGRRLLAEVPHVAVFDTSFFRTLPPAAYTYALRKDVAEKYSVRRYGAHGTSHEFVSQEAARVLGRDAAELNTIVLHLGNGASASAVRGGVAVETSMGLTPLEGLVMGTRTGDIDPAVVFHLARNAGMDIEQIDHLFNKESGIKGLSGENDFRELHKLIAAGNEDAKLALDVYIHRLRKYIGAYFAVLGHVDVIAFTAGVGENDHVVRELVLEGLEPMGIEIDPAKNEPRSGDARIISTEQSRTTVMVVPTNEELAIARQVVDVISA